MYASMCVCMCVCVYTKFWTCFLIFIFLCRFFAFFCFVLIPFFAFHYIFFFLYVCMYVCIQMHVCINVNIIKHTVVVDLNVNVILGGSPHCINNIVW